MIYPKNYVVFDFETSGLKPEENHILEIGAVKVVEGQEDREFHEYLDWGIEIPEFITNINKIDNALIAEKGKPAAEVLEKFMNFVDGYPVIGHNIVKFDLPFLFSAIYRANIMSLPEWQSYVNGVRIRAIDTAALFKARTLTADRYWFETTYDFCVRMLELRKFGMKYNVATCCQELGIINEDGQHEAMKDVALTAQIYQKLCLKN